MILVPRLQVENDRAVSTFIIFRRLWTSLEVFKSLQNPGTPRIKISRPLLKKVGRFNTIFLILTPDHKVQQDVLTGQTHLSSVLRNLSKNGNLNLRVCDLN